MKCVETRTRNGMRWRRYLTDDGRRIVTYELPVTVLLGATTMGRIQTRLTSYQKAEEQRARRARILRNINAGVKPLAIADVEGISTRHVQRIRKALNDKANKR
jgi:hypothetical protein